MAKKENKSKTNYNKKNSKDSFGKKEKNTFNKKETNKGKKVLNEKTNNKKEQSLSEGTTLIGIEKRNLAVIKEETKAITKVPGKEIAKTTNKDMIVKNEQKSIAVKEDFKFKKDNLIRKVNQEGRSFETKRQKYQFVFHFYFVAGIVDRWTEFFRGQRRRLHQSSIYGRSAG